MIDVVTDVFNRIYDAVVAKYPTAQIDINYVNQPSSFPSIQIWDESNTCGEGDMNLSGDECFSNVVIHIEVFDNTEDGENVEIVKDIYSIIDPEMRKVGYRRTYFAPVSNYDDASIYRKIARYSKKQPYQI